MSPAEVSQSYTYNADLEDDEENENIEGFILYFSFRESQFNPDDFSRLSHTSGVTLVTLIDNDGRELAAGGFATTILSLTSAVKLTCEQRASSPTTFVVTCNASATPAESSCSYDSSTQQRCTGFQSLGISKPVAQ